jgi:hypothetical protein
MVFGINGYYCAKPPSMRITILALLLVISCNIHAEKTVSEKLKAWSSRTLVVEVPEVNPNLSKSWPDKKVAEMSAAYEATVASYAEQIEPAIRKYWTFNKKIEFKTTSEIMLLFKEKNPNYVALLKGGQTPEGVIYANIHSKGVPVLLFVGTDGDTKVNKYGELSLRDFAYSFYCVADFAENGAESFTEAGMKFSLVQLQHVLEWEVTTNTSKNYGYMQYAKNQSEKNCSKLAPKKLLVDKDGLDKSLDRTEAMNSYGPNLELVDRAEMESAYLNEDAEKAVFFSVYGLGKVVVAPSTNEILGFAAPKMANAVIWFGLTAADISQLKKCK